MTAKDSTNGTIKEPRINRKQRIFIEALANGATYSDAYMAAYPKSRKWSHSARSANAARLLKIEYISDALDKRRAELQEIEHEKNRWTRERTIQERIQAIDGIKQARDTRINAIRAEAESYINNPPTDMSPERVLIEVQRILQKPTNVVAANAEIVRICDSLDRITGLVSKNGDASDSPVIVIKEEDVDE